MFEKINTLWENFSKIIYLEKLSLQILRHPELVSGSINSTKLVRC